MTTRVWSRRPRCSRSARERGVGLVESRKESVAEHGKVALVRVPRRLTDLKALREVVPAHVHKSDARFDQSPGQQRTRTEQRPAVLIANAIRLALHIERRADGSRCEHVEGQLLRAVVVRRRPCGTAQSVFELCHQSVAVLQAIWCEVRGQLGFAQVWFTSQRLRRPLVLRRLVHERGAFGAIGVIATPEKATVRAALLPPLAPAE